MDDKQSLAKMKLSRRTLLLSGGASLVASRVKAAALGSQSGAGGGRHVATVKFQNISPSAATPAESYITFGQSFVMGDVPHGNRPALKRADTGGILPAQFDLRSTWPDGSLRWCEVSCVAPSVQPRAALTVDLYSEAGSYNNAKTRSLADITSNSDIKIAISNCVDYSGARFMGGAQTLRFNAASNLRAELVKSGPICDQWRVWDWFPGQPSGGEQLAGFFYVTAWTKQSNGSLAAIQHITKVHNGWLNKAHPTKYIYSCVYSDGRSLNRDFGSLPSYDKPFSYSGKANEVTCISHGRTASDPVLVSGDSLPAKMVAGAVYYANPVDANTLKFGGDYDNLNSVRFNGGSGSLQFRIAHHNKTQWWCTRSDAKPDWTDNEATIHVQQDVAYLHKSMMVLPYDLTLRLPSKPRYQAHYSPFRLGSSATEMWYPGDIDSAGGWPDRGWMPQWCIFAYLTQSREWADQSRIFAAALTTPQYYLNESTGKIPALRGSSPTGDSGDYRGLGTTLNRIWQVTGINQAGILPFTGGGGGWRASDGYDWSHAPQPYYYVALTEGGAHWIDMQMIYANHVLIYMPSSGSAPWSTWPTAQQRTARLSGQSHVSYDIFCLDPAYGNTRSMGFRFTGILNALMLAPDTWIEQEYFKNIINNMARFANEFITQQPDLYKKSGLWEFTSGEWFTIWMQYFLIAPLAQASVLLGTAALRKWTHFVAQMPISLANGDWPCAIGLAATSYTVRSVGSERSFAHLLPWSQIGISSGSSAGDGVGVSTNASSNRCELSRPLTLFLLSEGAGILWPTHSVAQAPQTPPHGIVPNAWYHVVNVSGKSFQVSDAPGGAPVAIGDSRNLQVSWRPRSCPIHYDYTNGDAALSMGVAVLAVLKAFQFDVGSAYERAKAMVNPAIDYTRAPNWAMQPTV